MEKGTLLGRGRTAEIFAWGDRQVLKLLFDWCPAAWAKEEAAITRAVHEAGLPAPAVEDIIEVEGRYGTIFERVDGPSMLQGLISEPWKAISMARLLAELQAAMHTHQIPGLRSYRQSLESGIRRAEPLPPHLKQAVLQALDRLPGGDALCHGDFHPDNVIMSPRGPVILDWMAAASGNPLGDVTRTSLLLRLGELPPGMPGRRRIEAMRSQFHKTWLRRYLQLWSASRRERAAWELPVAAARLNEDIPGEQTSLLRIVEAAVSEH